MRKRLAPVFNDNHERWLLTYADLITLLLAFFVVMYSMSQIDAKRFGAMTSALTGALRGQEDQIKRLSADDLRGGAPLKTGELRLMQRQLDQAIHHDGQDSAISSDLSERGLVIHVREGALFDEAKAELTGGALSILRLIGGEIQGLSNHVRVEGHTDVRPINTPRFPSNWELSTARATAVLRFLVDSSGFPPIRISAVGYAEFRPVASNDTPAQMAQNRRVDIVVLSDKMSQLEPVGQPAGGWPSSPSPAQVNTAN